MLAKLYEFADFLRHHGRKRHMTADHALGRRGEDIAHRFLQRAGFVIVDRNYRMASGGGEVDLIGMGGRHAGVCRSEIAGRPTNMARPTGLSGFKSNPV